MFVFLLVDYKYTKWKMLSENSGVRSSLVTYISHLNIHTVQLVLILEEKPGCFYNHFTFWFSLPLSIFDTSGFFTIPPNP